MPTLTRIQGYIYNASGTILTTGKLRITAQQDFTSVDGTKVAPFTTTVDLAAASPLGLVDVYLFATVGAEPSGLSYYVEFDPDPADTTRPTSTKNGYWSNYWVVPDTASIVPLGNFTQAIRGTPVAGYMPASGTVTTGTNSVFIGASATPAVTKNIYAYQAATDNPGIRYNHSNSKWEFTHDGTTWYTIGAEGVITATDSDDFLFGENTNTTKTIKANIPVTDKPAIRYNVSSGKWEFTNDGVDFIELPEDAASPTASLISDWLFMIGGI